ncbi:MAG: hypothetical protein LAT82_00260 [Nanoarchaeota archaeon]|nr:hypothetical protein [Nanoarchaeota archaeon]
MALDSTQEANPSLHGRSLEAKLEKYEGISPKVKGVKAVYRLAQQSVRDFISNLPRGFSPYGTYRVIGNSRQHYCDVSSEIDGTGSPTLRIQGPYKL